MCDRVTPEHCNRRMANLPKLTALSADALMRRRHGSMHKRALSADLAQGARLGARGGVAARQAGGVATCDTQPLHHHITSILLRPRALANTSDRPQTRQEYRARLVRPIPLKPTKTCFSTIQGLKLKARAGIPARSNVQIRSFLTYNHFLTTSTHTILKVLTNQ